MAVRASRGLVARRRRIDRDLRRLREHAIQVSRHAVERWLERVDPSASPAAAEEAMTAFVRQGRLIARQYDGGRLLASHRWPGVRLVVVPRPGAWFVVTARPDPRLGSA
jgi:hypothetical protein